MEFRPCIDIHNGKVKQIVGSSLRDAGDQATENYVSERSAADFARLYESRGLRGGHVILLNAKDSPYYEKTKEQAFAALAAYPNGLQAGGGITDENAADFIRAGASHVIVTSYVFAGGEIRFDRLERLVSAVGKEHIVLDLSCKKTDTGYYVATDRWQRLTDARLDVQLLTELSGYADEFLIHAVDVEGKAHGIEQELVAMLGGWDGIPITYAGGVGSFGDLEQLRTLGRGRIHVTIGSALDLFGGTMPFDAVCGYVNGQTEKRD